MKQIDLPIVPSELILLALKDLKKAERRKNVKIDMNVWFSWIGEKTPFGMKEDETKCLVCLAGAIIIGTLGEPIDSSKGGKHIQFESENRSKLLALNFFRVGEIDLGLFEMKIRTPGTLEVTREIHRYEENPNLFYLDMKQLAADLKAVGL